MRMLSLGLALNLAISLPAYGQSALPPAHPRNMSDTKAELFYRIELAERCETLFARLYGPDAQASLSIAEQRRAQAAAVDMYGLLLMTLVVSSMPSASAADRGQIRGFLANCAAKLNRVPEPSAK